MMARASWAYPPMATGTTAAAAADAPDRGCASPSPEGVAEVEPLVTLTHLLQFCRDEHAVLWERVNDPVGPGDQLAEILADDSEIVGGEGSGENIAAFLAFHAGECQMCVRKNESAVVAQIHAETLRLRVLAPADELLLFAIG